MFFENSPQHALRRQKQRQDFSSRCHAENPHADKIQDLILQPQCRNQCSIQDPLLRRPPMNDTDSHREMSCRIRRLLHFFQKSMDLLLLQGLRMHGGNILSVPEDHKRLEK